MVTALTELIVNLERKTTHILPFLQWRLRNKDKEMNEEQRWRGITIQVYTFGQTLVKMGRDKRCHVGEHVFGLLIIEYSNEKLKHIIH